MFDRRGPTFVELARQALSSTERGYDLLAPKFEYTPFRTPDELLAQIAPHLGAHGRALDVCCGTGAAVRMLRPLCDEVVGLDMSEGMLSQAEELCASAAGEAPLVFVRGDALAMPFDQEFDLAVTFGANGHILPRDEPAFFASVFRALKPGGRFFLLTSVNPGPLHPYWWAAQGFNTVMHARNALVDPPFVMFYLTMTWPKVRAPLEAAGFWVEAHHGLLTGLYRGGILVECTRPI